MDWKHVATITMIVWCLYCYTGILYTIWGLPFAFISKVSRSAWSHYILFFALLLAKHGNASNISWKYKTDKE